MQAFFFFSLPAADRIELRIPCGEIFGLFGVFAFLLIVAVRLYPTLAE